MIASYMHLWLWRGKHVDLRGPVWAVAGHAACVQCQQHHVNA